jgi:hypothetical protein
MNRMYKSLIILLLAVIGCQTNNSEISIQSLVNPTHLDHLYEQVETEGRSMAIIHIYSDYPDYKWTWESHEGIACVDDLNFYCICRQKMVISIILFWKILK